MVARAEDFRLNDHPIRRILGPALGWAALAAIVALIRRATREPRVTPMSEHWLANHDRGSNRFDY